MSLTAVGLIALALSSSAFGLIGHWYVSPWLRRAGSRRAALTPLLWLHVFRYVALLLYSVQAAGLAISDTTRDQIVLGDLLGAAAALACIVALRRRSQWAAPLGWLLVVTTLVDIGNAAYRGLAERLFEVATGWPWFILTFYVPALLVSALLVGRELWRPAVTSDGRGRVGSMAASAPTGA